MPTFVYNKSPSENHLTALLPLLADAERVFICSGHLKEGGVELLADALVKAVSRGAQVTVYSNKRDTTTDAETALKKLGIEHIVVAGFYLHTKLYFFESSTQVTAILGSANITEGALTSNEEFSTVFTGTKKCDQLRKIAEYAAYLDVRCRAARASYQAKVRRRTKLPKPLASTAGAT